MDALQFFGTQSGLLDSLVAIIVALGLYILRNLRHDTDCIAEETAENTRSIAHIEGFLQAQTKTGFRKLHSRMGNEE